MCASGVALLSRDEIPRHSEHGHPVGTDRRLSRSRGAGQSVIDYCKSQLELQLFRPTVKVVEYL